MLQFTGMKTWDALSQQRLLSPSSSLCSKLQIQSEMDSAQFLETLAGNFMDVVQYNGDNRAFEVRNDKYYSSSHVA